MGGILKGGYQGRHGIYFVLLVNLCQYKTCIALNQCHDIGSCNPGTGECSHPKKEDGILCDDGNDSTVGDQCVSGVCAGSNF